VTRNVLKGAIAEGSVGGGKVDVVIPSCLKTPYLTSGLKLLVHNLECGRD